MSAATRRPLTVLSSLKSPLRETPHRRPSAIRDYGGCTLAPWVSGETVEQGGPPSGSGSSSAGEDRSAERGTDEKARRAVKVVVVDATDVGDRAVRDLNVGYLTICRSGGGGGGGRDGVGGPRRSEARA